MGFSRYGMHDKSTFVRVTPHPHPPNPPGWRGGSKQTTTTTKTEEKIKKLYYIQYLAVYITVCTR